MIVNFQDPSNETMNVRSNVTQGAPPRIKAADRLQADPNPRILDALIPPDHPARRIWALIQELDLSPLYGRIKAVEGHAGASAIDPRILTALWIYATKKGISSARELERRCYESDPFKWLRGGVDVNYHTLADFRTAHPEWLKEQFVQNVAAMRAEGLVNLDVVGQDGLRVRASAGSGSFKKAETLERLLEEAEAQWNRLQEESARQEHADLSPRQKAARERAARERIARLKAAREEVKKVAAAREKRKPGDGENARASTTDPPSRRMKMPDGGTRPAYNLQFATTLNTLVIVGTDGTNAGSDASQMDPMAEQIEEGQGEVPKELHTDGSYSTREQIEKVGQRGVTVFAPIMNEEKKQSKGQDPYAPQKGDTPKVADWRRRMGTQEAKEKYRQRSKCEWTNAQCRLRGLWQFTVRGLEKVKAVGLWYALTHNLHRMVALRAERLLTAA
jgi:transposase